MALINCAECNKEISDKADACNNCGAPTKAPPPPSAKPASGGTLEAIGFLLIVGGMITAIATNGPADTAAKVAAFAGVIVFLAGRFRRH